MSFLIAIHVAAFSFRFVTMPLCCLTVQAHSLTKHSQTGKPLVLSFSTRLVAFFMQKLVSINVSSGEVASHVSLEQLVLVRKTQEHNWLSWPSLFD